jgi:amino acid transporter
VNQRFHTPDYAFVLMGVIATAVTVINYGLFASKESVFWTVFALSSIIFLLPYLLIFPALLVLRVKRADTPRPYRVPGGRAGAWLWVVLCEAGMVFTIVAFFWLVPEGTSKALFWSFTGGGTLIAIVVGLLLGRGGGGEVAAIGEATAIPEAAD